MFLRSLQSHLPCLALIGILSAHAGPPTESFKERAKRLYHSGAEGMRTLLKGETPQPIEFLLPVVQHAEFPLPQEVSTTGFEQFKKTATLDFLSLGEDHARKLFACYLEYHKQLKELQSKNPKQPLRGLGVHLDGNTCRFSYAKEDELAKSAFSEIKKLSGARMATKSFGSLKLPHEEIAHASGLFFGIEKPSILSAMASDYVEKKKEAAQEAVQSLLDRTGEKLPLKFNWDNSDYQIELPSKEFVSGYISHQGPSRLETVSGHQSLIVPFSFVEGIKDKASNKLNEETSSKGIGELAFTLREGRLVTLVRKSKPTQWYKRWTQGQAFTEWETGTLVD